MSPGTPKPCAAASASRLGPPLEPEHDRIEEKPNHEVFPVDVDPPPVVGETRRQQVIVMRLGKLEAIQVEHAAGNVKLARNLEIQAGNCRPGSTKDWPGRAPSTAGINISW